MLTNSSVPAMYVSIKGGKFRLYNREQNSEEYYDTLEGNLTGIWQGTRTVDRLIIPEWRFSFESHDDVQGDVRIILSGLQDNALIEDMILRLATYVDYCVAQNLPTGTPFHTYIRLYEKRNDAGRRYSKCYMSVNGTPVRSRYVAEQPPDDWEKPFGLDWVVVPQHTWVDSAYNRVKVTNKERLLFIEQLAEKVNNAVKVSTVPF